MEKNILIETKIKADSIFCIYKYNDGSILIKFRNGDTCQLNANTEKGLISSLNLNNTETKFIKLKVAKSERPMEIAEIPDEKIPEFVYFNDEALFDIKHIFVFNNESLFGTNIAEVGLVMNRDIKQHPSFYRWVTDTGRYWNNTYNRYNENVSYISYVERKEKHEDLSFDILIEGYIWQQLYLYEPADDEECAGFLYLQLNFIFMDNKVVDE